MSSLVLRLATLLAAFTLTSPAWANGGAGGTAGQEYGGLATGTGRLATGMPATNPLGGLTPATPEGWVMRLRELARGGLTFKNREAFIEWLDALVEPRYMTALATVALVPERHPQVLGYGIDPTATRNWSEYTDPNLYLRLRLAGMEGRYDTAILSRSGNPNLMSPAASFTLGSDACGPFLKFLNLATSQWRGDLSVVTGIHDPATRSTSPATAQTGIATNSVGAPKQVAPLEDALWRRLPEPYLPTVGMSPRAPQRY